MAQAPTIGALRERVQLKRRDVADDGQGGALTTFVPVATVWARVRALSARLATSADARGSAITHSVVMRYRSDVSAGDRLVFAGRNLEVVSAADLDGRRAYLACTCSEVAVTG